MKLSFIYTLFVFSFILIFVAACVPANQKIPALEPSYTETPNPSLTPGPTKTLEPTYTATVTYTPSPTQDNFNDLKVCPDYKKPCSATSDDLLSGRIIRFAQKVGQPFPPEAYNTGKFWLWDTKTMYGQGTEVGWVVKSSGNPEELVYRTVGNKIVPYRWLMFFLVEYKGLTYKIAIQQWLNPNKSISYLQYVVGLVGYKDDELQAENILFMQMGVGFPICDEVPSQIEWAKNSDMLLALSISDVDRVKLIKEWVKTGNIPEELQYKLLDPVIGVNQYTSKK